MNKRKGLPQWLKDALDKKEKEKKKKLDKEKGKKTKGDEDDTTGNSSLVTVATPTKKVCLSYTGKEDQKELHENLVLVDTSRLEGSRESTD